MSLKEYVIKNVSKNPIGFLKKLVLTYMKEYNIPYEKLEEIKNQTKKILSEIAFYYSANDMYELREYESIYENNLISKLKYHITRLNGYIIGLDSNKFSEITHYKIKESFKILEIDNILILDEKIEFKGIYDNVSINIRVTPKRFSLEADFIEKMDKIFPFFEFLKNEGDYGYFQKAYLPLDSLVYSSFQILVQLISTHFENIYICPTEFNQTK